MVKEKIVSIKKTISENLASFIMGVLVVTILLASGINSFIKSTKKIALLKKSRNVAGSHSTPKKYKVLEGDDLCRIAERFYGSCLNAADITKVNGILNPDSIEIGQELIIPDIRAKSPTTGETSSVQTKKVTKKDTFYTVQDGDFLFKIAEEQYGDGNMWGRILEANDLQNPDFLSKGSRLRIPR